MKKLTFLMLSVLSASAFAGNYADNGKEGEPQNNKAAETHFYVDLGVNEYYFDQPGTNLPMDVGSYGNAPEQGIPYSTAEGATANADGWALNPTITLGYQFLTDNADLQKIFGQQNAIELHASYFHNTGTQDSTYDQSYLVNSWFITGESTGFAPGSQAMTDSSVSFDNTYEDIGLYYTGTKVINNDLINSPYIGIDFSYLKQDSNYTATLYDTTEISPGVYEGGGFPFPTTGSDDLSSYYMGIAFGDKATWLFKKNYGVYGKLGAGVYLEHTKLSATQTPISEVPDSDSVEVDAYLTDLYTVNTSDDQMTFKATAEVGLNYYFKNNQDQMSPRVTLLAGLDYWNDVAYAQNPTQANEQVSIAYASSLNPYAGLQLHIPL